MKKLGLLIFTLISLSFAGSYSASKAVEYAHQYTINKSYQNCNQWDGKSCPEYWNTQYPKRYVPSGSYGTDCMHFISQAIHYGGIPFDKVGGNHSSPKVWYHNFNTGWASDTFVNVNEFKSRMLSEYFENYTFTKVPLTQAKAGDLFFITGHAQNLNLKCNPSSSR